MKEHQPRFAARLPPDLKEALKEMAESTPGISQNDLVVQGVRHVVEGADLIVSPGVRDAHEDLVVGVIEGDIAPAIGIANHFTGKGQPRLGALLFFFAAQMQPDDREKAKELVRTADNIEKKGSRPIAKAMLEEALKCNPSSDVAKSRLGQLMYFDGDYERARTLLEAVREDDNYAKLAYGWSVLELAGDNRDDLTRARDEIVVALRRWALRERSAEQREKWLRQVAQLKARGPDFEQAADDLVAYANNNASWKQIDPTEIKPPPRHLTREPDFEELAGEA